MGGLGGEGRGGSLVYTGAGRGEIREPVKLRGGQRSAVSGQLE
jgi:hypothetical protein